MARFTLVGFALLAILTPTLASADYGFSEEGSGGMDHDISVGAGIAAPGATSAYAENPAGIAYENGTVVQPSAASENSNLDPIDLAALAFFGNGSVGAAIGAQAAMTGGAPVLLDYGLAANIPSADISIGLAGTYNLGTGEADPWGLNAGAIFNAHGPLRFGATVYNMIYGIGGFGAGVAYDLSPDATIVADGGSDQHLNGKTLTPGLRVRVRPIELAVSYGIDVDDNGGSPIPRGTTLGVGFAATDSVHVIAYYNELEKYYLALTIHM